MLTGVGISLLGGVSSGDEGGDSTDLGDGICGDVILGAGVGVYVMGALAVAVCLVFFRFVTGVEAGSVLVLSCWSSKLVFLGSSSSINLLFLSVSLLVPSVHSVHGA